LIIIELNKLIILVNKIKKMKKIIELYKKEFGDIDKEINILIDVSGSFDISNVTDIFADVISNNITINLILCDQNVEYVEKINTLDFSELIGRKIKIGGGGTILQSGLNFISDINNNIDMFNTIIITDGYTDSLNFEKIKTNTLIIVTDIECPISFDNGKVKQFNNHKLERFNKIKVELTNEIKKSNSTDYYIITDIKINFLLKKISELEEKIENIQK